MKTNNLFRLAFRTCLVVVLLPAASAVAGTMTCECGGPTEESYTWDFAAEATERFDEMESHAEAAEDHAGRSAAYADHSLQMSWQSHAQELAQTKAHLNRISRSLCRLKLIERVTMPWQQQVIGQIEPLLNDAASGTEEAIDLLNERRQALVTTDFGDYVEQAHHNAGLIDETIERFLDRREPF